MADTDKELDCSMDDIAIGIDLGTTNSCAAYYINGRVKILENSDGGRITPSYLFFTERSGVIVGHYAKHMAEAKPEYGIYEIKRLIGRNFDDVSVQNNLQYFPFQIISESNSIAILIKRQKDTLKKTVEALCTAILTKIKKDVQEKLGQTITKAVITVPAYFNVSQREATLTAATKAGFTVLKLLNEPTAAALSYYLENNCEEVTHSLVYDLGGGTFDVAILKRNGTSIDIICVEGDTHLGGKDFDNLIIDYVCEELTKKYNYNPKENPRTMHRLQNLCEEAKKTLSAVEEYDIVLNGFVEDHKLIEIALSRIQFEKMAHKHFKRTIEIVDSCLKSSFLSKSDIKEVILSGGSSRIPKIQEMLSEYFDGKKLNKFVNPDECVAEGAAIQAAMLSKNPQQEIKEMQIKDVIPLSLGVSDVVDMMTFLIKRNTTIPVSESYGYVTVYNNQTSLTFCIYEGERLNALKNHKLGTLKILDLTPAPPRECEVIITMSMDQNGILKVTAKEKFRDNVKDLKIVYTRGHRSDSEVKNALHDAEVYREEDERFRVFAYQKQYVLEYCISIIYNIENKDLVKTYKDIYNFCQELEVKVLDMNMDNSKKLKLLMKEVKGRCESLVQKHNFKHMPTLRT